jgi:transcriptional regulator with XRE-family HTH domain
MDNKIVHRLKLFMQSQGMNNSDLARSLGYQSPEKLSRLFRDNEAKPSYDTIFDIAKSFAFLNIGWLITGEGNMLKDAPEDALQDAHFKPNIKNYNLVEEPPGQKPPGCAECVKKDSIILHFQKQIEKLTNIIEKLTDNIDSEQKRKVS